MPLDYEGLLPIQALALATLAESEAPRGLIGALAVGAGKTLVAMLAPLVTGNEGKAVLLLPASLLDQWRTDVAKWTPIYPCEPPIAVSYGKLSHPRHREILDRLRPNLVIMDEAHFLANPQSTRTKRIIRYFQAYPDTRAVVLSGSITGASILDYAHLAELALRDGSPLPREIADLERWSACLDASTTATANDYLSIWPLVRAFRYSDPGPMKRDHTRGYQGDRRIMAQTAYRARLRSTPGVVASAEGSIGASLYLRRIGIAIPGVDSALSTLSDKWELPDGTELASALEYAAYSRSISVGYYYRREPGPPEYADARREWSRILRYALASGVYEGADSPGLLTARVERGDASQRLIRALRRYREVMHLAPPVSETVWLPGADMVVLRGILELLKDAPPTVVWYTSRAMGALLDVILKTYGQGTKPPRQPEHVACSALVHGKGWNAQMWARNLFIEPFSSAVRWEQTLGRTHRTGQTAGAVEALINLGYPPLSAALATASKRAGYIERTTGARQKISIGQWLV